LGVGVIAVKSDGLEYVVQAQRFGGSMGLSMSYPAEVKSNSTFEFSLTIQNNGQKILANVEATYIQSHPFSSPEGEQSSKKLEDIQLNSSGSVSFVVKVAQNVAPDTSPFESLQGSTENQSELVQPFRKKFYAKLEKAY
jgi:hypothetical protein